MSHKSERKEIHVLEEILKEDRKHTELLRDILKALKAQPPQSLKSVKATFIPNGGTMGASASMHVNGTGGTSVLTGFDGPSGSGKQVPLIGPVTWVSDQPGFATVDANTGATAPVAAGVANITGTDAASGFSDTYAMTVSADTVASVVAGFVSN